jgi:hypothetical protein
MTNFFKDSHAATKQALFCLKNAESIDESLFCAARDALTYMERPRPRDESPAMRALGFFLAADQLAAFVAQQTVEPYTRIGGDDE